MNSIGKKALSLSAAAVMLSSAAAVPTYAEETTVVPVQTYTAAASATPAAPVIVKKIRKSSAVTIKWTAVSGASGYKVYKKVNGKWKTAGTVRSGTTVKFKVKNLNSDTKYKFRLKAFTKSGGKTYFSKASKAVTVTTKAGLGYANYSNSVYSFDFRAGKWKDAGSKDNAYIKYTNNGKVYANFLVKSNKNKAFKKTTAEKYAEEVIAPGYTKKGYSYTYDSNAVLGSENATTLRLTKKDKNSVLFVTTAIKGELCITAVYMTSLKNEKAFQPIFSKMLKSFEY